MKENNNRFGSIDLGLNNLATLTSNVCQSMIYDGRKLKSINHFYNKRKGQLQSKLTQNKHTSKRIQRLTNRRNNKLIMTTFWFSRFMMKTEFFNLSNTETQNSEKESIKTKNGLRPIQSQFCLAWITAMDLIGWLLQRGSLIVYLLLTAELIMPYPFQPERWGSHGCSTAGHGSRSSKKSWYSEIMNMVLCRSLTHSVRDCRIESCQSDYAMYQS